jgi:hypothetical protein
MSPAVISAALDSPLTVTADVRFVVVASPICP